HRWPQPPLKPQHPYTREELHAAADGGWPERGERCDRCGAHRRVDSQTIDARTAGAKSLHGSAAAIREDLGDSFGPTESTQSGTALPALWKATCHVTCEAMSSLP